MLNRNRKTTRPSAKWTGLAAVGASLVFASAPVFAGEDHDHDENKPVVEESQNLLMDEAERAAEAAKVLQSALSSDDKAIPETILKQATGIVVIPNVIKGAFFVGGQYGKGLVAWRGDDGEWNAPAFVGMGGASYGFQAGIENVDLMLVMVGDGGAQALLDDNLKLSASAGVTAGPIGRNAEIGTNITLDSGIYAYSHSKGLFAGVSLDGAVVTIDEDANEKVYGEGTTGDMLLRTEDVDVNDAVRSFWDALNNYVPNLDS